MLITLVGFLKAFAVNTVQYEKHLYHAQWSSCVWGAGGQRGKAYKSSQCVGLPEYIL